MVITLAQLELVLLNWICLALLLMPWPVPRPWAMPAIFLLAVQTFAVRGIRGDGDVRVGPQGTPNSVDTFSDVMGVYVVPGLTAGLILVVLFHLARANGEIRRRAREVRARPSAGTSRPAAARRQARGPA